MKAKISALMDGELERGETAAPLEALGSEGEERNTWRTYHLISDAMRDTQLLSAGFSARVCARLAGEPTVMAPNRLRQPAARVLWRALPAAASVAAVALVGWLAFAPQEAPGPALQAAKTPAPAAASQEVKQMQQAQRAAKAPLPAAVVPPPEAANDYLLAHQGYSPRNSLQGMAPYVRTVSDEAWKR